MSKITFTPEQVAALRANPYVKTASEKSITYTDEFKRHFVSETLLGKSAKRIFEEADFPVGVLGEERIKSFAKKWRKRYREDGILSFGVPYSPPRAGEGTIKKSRLERKEARKRWKGK